ncbi:MAG: hypothetical protein Fur0046_00040 [Cyanobacteria bacterium J069]
MEIEAQQAIAAPSATLLSYSSFLTQYPDTALNTLAKQQSSTLFQQHQPEKLADAALCPKIAAVSSMGLVPTPETQIPALHYACGNAYVAQKDLGTALTHYNTVLTEHPNAAEAKDAEAAIARTLVDQANETGAGKIPPPRAVGSSGNRSSVVKIRNNSPKVLRIVFSGPEPQFAELPPCADCQVYTAPASSCPEKGAEGTYTLKPGRYSVLVRAADDSSVTPFTGDWSMQQGKAYSSCFYLVRRPR